MAFAKEWRGVGSLECAIAPWETAPNGVVSLLAMLEFAADEFIEIAHKFGLVVGEWERPGELNPNVLGNSLDSLLNNCSSLGLKVTLDQIIALIGEIQRSSPENVHIQIENNKLVRFEVTDGQLPPERLAHHLEVLHSTLRSELGGRMFKAIPLEKARYCAPDWLKGSETPDKFPTSLKELQRAWSCYSFGEPTASVFHSMRALETALAALAAPFNISSKYENWQNIIEQIERAVRGIGQQPKSQQKIDDETFFGAAASHLYFVKNAWRNHVSHTRESYNDTEALKIMDETVHFIESLCPRLSEPT